MAEVLDAETVRAELEGLDGWSGDPAGIGRTVELPGFREAIDVVDRVAVVAEKLDHHPDIDIRWRTVTFRCVTHAVGGVTRRDIELARRIDETVRGAA
ncbi:4a-hydroxytetrahydrobiopterin dehydratase [Micromonospora sp. HM5-17]|jgi:4a-hydroxytetrahydrobiopterin dehydratase|uniref:4a-hydroxytetrahydrobiopterin dehydratase n=1 Tax=Micromonospora sp. HM5-17 TaxID=2487710 RepID=UPI000F4676A0|nr:4a-hydroxytetrahydrobiopterin dehydratase [Micromonospora sp. HM5-17]ROT32279.1 4a-hydroxytetrahydrobiopterin dehydratase [Micromonospora sp. HM5-17]